MRKLLLQVHLWVGITAALVLIALGTSGALLVFEDQIDRALNPQLSRVKPAAATLPLAVLQRSAESAHPGYHVTAFAFSGREDVAYAIDLQPSSGPRIEVAIDQHTGEVLGTWDDSRFTRKLHLFHTRFLAGKMGQAVVGWGGGVFLLGLSISGLILWWPRKLASFHWNSFGTKFHYDLHNTVGAYASAFLLFFALTGIVIHWEREASNLASQVSHAPARERAPKVAASPDANQSTPDEWLQAAAAAAPEAQITGLVLPGDKDSPAMVGMKFPEDRTPAGRTHAYIDPYTGKVLLLASSRAMPAPISFVRRINRELHTGDIFGWPTRILAAIFSLSLPVLAITGPMIWWNRKMAGRRAQARKQAMAA